MRCRDYQDDLIAFLLDSGVENGVGDDGRRATSIYIVGAGKEDIQPKYTSLQWDQFRDNSIFKALMCLFTILFWSIVLSSFEYVE